MLHISHLFSGIGVLNVSSGIYEDPYGMYETPKNDENTGPHDDYIDNSAGDQEYAYAKETDFSKSNGGITNALNRTLKQEEPAINQVKYSYLKKTDKSLTPLGTCTEQRDEHSAAQNDSALYHTLEEPQQPQPPVYLTLEGPDDVDQ